MKRILMALAVLLFASLAWATTLTCSIDSFMLSWTGRTRIDTYTAKMLYEHRCLNGHTFWLTTEQMNQ